MSPTVSPLAASLIRGCHPTFSSKPCNDDWFLVSILDYYRMHHNPSHPHPGKYWRFPFDMKWGWEFSITDFKTQSIKEYIHVSKLLRKRKQERLYHMLCIQRVLSPYSNTSPLTKLIMRFICLPTLKQTMQSELRYLPPTRLPIIHPINPIQVFLGRCYQYGFIHPKTTTCYIKKRITFAELAQHCRVMPRPYIRHPQITIHNKSTLFFLIQCIVKEDQKQYIFPTLSPLHAACHYNFSGNENNHYYHYNTNPKEAYLKTYSIMDIWISDLFGW